MLRVTLLDNLNIHILSAFSYAQIFEFLETKERINARVMALIRFQSNA